MKVVLDTAAATLVGRLLLEVSGLGVAPGDIWVHCSVGSRRALHFHLVFLLKVSQRPRPSIQQVAARKTITVVEDQFVPKQTRRDHDGDKGYASTHDPKQF